MRHRAELLAQREVVMGKLKRVEENQQRMAGGDDKARSVP